jgi:nucleotide-binding universal stress UspA family protein
MTLILCATRGGEESISAQDKAIALAKERSEPLTFVYVADSSFLDKTAAAVVVNVEAELAQMGKFFLAMAVERAKAENVRAEAVIRSGTFRETLQEVARELGATTIVLGRPAGDTGQFDEEGFAAFLETLAEDTGARVVTA